MNLLPLEVTSSSTPATPRGIVAREMAHTANKFLILAIVLPTTYHDEEGKGIGRTGTGREVYTSRRSVF